MYGGQGTNLLIEAFNVTAQNQGHDWGAERKL